ncbi:facilitated trehalose transporter Tret1-like isoform X2 [Pseudomyrmex gracilis]|uniref:facilitated trehalose transporter Tret1-like isoform X2 n=1 Tax=Pseudomyrmex gracilis TaxID=219809 RepID=UPI0009950FA8|nr:facilitated trehalose transporter Tret1-like isoform X2 [Pseudomyrmex gracilis]
METEKQKIQKIMWPQWIAANGVTLLLMQVGMMSAWSSPYVAYLTSPKSHIPMTMNEASWVVSLLNLGRLIGAFFGAVSVNYFGSKTTIFITCIPYALCWLFMIVANRVEWLYVSRFLGGIAFGKTYSCFSLYLSEIADPSIRGATVVLAMTGIGIGLLTMCIMGAYLSIGIASGISFAHCFIVMVIFLWLPESPHHLIKIRAEEKARASIRWYHRDCDVESELHSLKKFIEMNRSTSVVNVIKEFRVPHIGKALVLVTVLYMYGQMCGMNNVVFYMETILRSAQVTVLEPAVVVIIVSGIGIVSSLFSMMLIDKFGRRVLLVISSVTVAISLICLGTDFQLLDADYDPVDLQVLPIFSVVLFQVAVFMGIFSIPNTVLGEIFPPHVKCMASCITSITAGLFAFISTSTYQPLINLLTEKYVFYVYSLLLITAVPFAIFCIPETKGKSLQQIQEELKKG